MGVDSKSPLNPQYDCFLDVGELEKFVKENGVVGESRDGYIRKRRQRMGSIVDQMKSMIKLAFSDFSDNFSHPHPNSIETWAKNNPRGGSPTPA